MAVEAPTFHAPTEQDVRCELGGSGNIAVIFQGQGSHETGMGQDLYEKYPTAKKIYDLADKTLGYSISNISFNNTNDELKETRYAQPAILVRNHAQWEVLKEQIPSLANPAYFVGLSLGELNAYIAAGAVGFEDMLRIVDKRAEAMQKVCEENPGGYLVVTARPKNPDEPSWREQVVYAHALQGLYDLGLLDAAFISPFSMIFGGRKETIQDGENFLREYKKKFKQALTLLHVTPDVAGPFHTHLMESAVPLVREAVTEAHVREVHTPVIANTTGEPVYTPDQIREALIDHVASPMKIMQSVSFLKAQGVDTFVEVGKKEIVTKMIRTRDQSEPLPITVPGKDKIITIANHLVPLEREPIQKEIAA